jgi:hypothetical protein
MRSGLIMLFVFMSFGIFAQEQLSLENLNDFRDQAGNWLIVESVTMNRNIDVHHKEKEASKAKSKKKKKKKEKIIEESRSVNFTPGTGILLNLNDKQKKDALITNWEHGDIKLELEVMLPKGSNSGIYLQGRYELQLLDSWGVKNPKYSDIGGIFRNWENEPDKIFRGIAPSSNAAKAPGLWQRFSIHFQAPRFNEKGQKIANAKFVYVDLNGVRIHSNVEIPTYTGGQISKEEVAKGPIMIQGDHGPVAIRNFKYQLLEESSVELSSLTYKIFKGAFKSLKDLDDQEEVLSGTSKKLDINLVGQEDEYGIVYSGNIAISKDDSYRISVGYSGGISLVVDDKLVLENNSSSAEGKLEKELTLSKGNHSIVLTNIKSAAWRAPRLGMFIESASTNPKGFHTYDSYPPDVSFVSPIYVDPTSEPRMLRAFVSFKGDGERLSHTIGVGIPSGVNYIYDLGSGNLIGAWRGNFVDATPMWHSRGDGSFKPRGAVQWTFLNQSIAKLESSTSAFPKTGTGPDFVSKGYIINQENGLPIFKHEYHGVAIENKIISDKSNKYLIREVNFSKSGMTNWYFKLASGAIKKMVDGSYAIEGQQYYINVLSGQLPVIREVSGETELVLPVDGSSIKYEIIW